VVRKQIAAELGIVIAPVRVHDDPLLDSHEYAIKVRGSEVARHRVVPGHRLAMNAGGAAVDVPGIPTVEPAFGLPAVWVEEERRAETEAFGYTVVDSETVIVTHLTETIRRHADELLTRQETKALLDALKERNAAAVEEVVPDRLSVGEVQRVLQHLLREGVSIRDLGTILETIGDASATTRDPQILAEHARRALSRSITGGYAEESGVVQAISLGPELEHEVSESLTVTPDGELLALEPGRAAALVEELRGFVDRGQQTGTRPVLLCSSRIRRHMRRLVEHSLPQLPVLAYGEIAPGFQIETQGVVNA
jgi:flagellar biosynthesis protein FlhA